MTLTPWTRCPAALRTSAARAAEKAVLTAADWLSPAAAVTVTGASSSAMVPVAVALLMLNGPRLSSSTDTSLL